MSQTEQTRLTDVEGIGQKTASNLEDTFGSPDVSLDAVQSIPNWVQENVDGIGTANLSNLREYAEKNGHTDQTDRKLTSLRGTKIKRRDTRYYACGQREDNLVLFYTGYYQGRSYSTSFSGRQNLTRDRVNRHLWAFYSFTKHDYVIVETHRRNKKQYIAEVIDSHDWKQVTDTGAVFYQQGRNYEIDHYPETSKGMKQTSRGTDTQELRGGIELVGISSDRIAIYRKGNTLFKYVREPTADGDDVLRRLYGYTHFTTDCDVKLGEYGTIETFVKKWSDEGKWKTYGLDTYVTDDYQSMV